MLTNEFKFVVKICKYYIPRDCIRLLCYQALIMLSSLRQHITTTRVKCAAWLQVVDILKTDKYAHACYWLFVSQTALPANCFQSGSIDGRSYQNANNLKMGFYGYRAVQCVSEHVGNLLKFVSRGKNNTILHLGPVA